MSDISELNKRSLFEKIIDWAIVVLFLFGWGRYFKRYSNVFLKQKKAGRVQA